MWVDGACCSRTHLRFLLALLSFAGMTYSFLSASGIQPPTQSKSGMLQLRLCMFPKSWVRTSPRNAIEQVHDFQLATHDHKLVGQPFIRIFIDVVPAPPLVSACALIPKLAVTFIITHHLLQELETAPFHRLHSRVAAHQAQDHDAKASLQAALGTKSGLRR